VVTLLGSRLPDGSVGDDPVATWTARASRPDQNYFARRFKAHYGLGATTYRKRFASPPVL
jgi:AraC family L-rhamnose operon transcriptional activator RhaR